MGVYRVVDCITEEFSNHLADLVWVKHDLRAAAVDSK